MGKITFEIMVLEGCAVRQRLQLKCNMELGWEEIEKKYKKIVRPLNIVSIRYRDSDGDMVTLSNGDDYREALKYATGLAASEPCLSVLLDVEQAAEAETVDVEPAPRMVSTCTSEASVSTLVSSFSVDSFDMASLKKEIVDSVLIELRKDQPQKSKKRRPKSAKSREPYCGACNILFTHPSVFFKCANCKCFFLCEECERKNQHGHTAGHAFLKLRGMIKPQFANKAVLKHLILQSEASPKKSTSAAVATATTSTSTPISQSVSTSADLMHFFDSESQPIKPRQDSMSLAREMDFISTSIVQEEGTPSQTRERSSSESTYESVENDQQEQQRHTSSVEKVDTEEEDDDFLVIPLPPCFDLEKPLISIPLPQPPKIVVQQTTPNAEPLTENKNNREESIQSDLHRLAESMSGTNVQQQVQETSWIDPPMPPAALQIPVEGVLTPAPPSYVPSPSSLVQQAASVFDSTPASISVTPRPPMDQLIEMGFGNRRLNEQLLELYRGSVEHVVADLLARETTTFQYFY